MEAAWTSVKCRNLTYSIYYLLPSNNVIGRGNVRGSGVVQ